MESSTKNTSSGQTMEEFQIIFRRFIQLLGEREDLHIISDKTRYFSESSKRIEFPERNLILRSTIQDRLPDFSSIYDEFIKRNLEELKEDSKDEKTELISTIKELKSELEEIKTRSEVLSEELNKIKEFIYEETTSFANNIKRQSIPVEIYLDTEESLEIFNVYEKVRDFIHVNNFDIALELKAIKGSWFKRFVAKSKDVLTSDEVFDRLKEAEYGLEVNTILKQQSEIDKNQSEALLNILKSVENVPNAAIRIGSLLVVKVTSDDGTVNVQSRSLSIKELYILNKKPELLTKPKSILLALSEAIDKLDNPDTQISPN